MNKNIIYIFIDASNLWQAQKAKGRFLDYEKTINFISKRFASSKTKIFYYAAYPALGTRNYSLTKKHDFFTFLKKGLGFSVIKKELKRIKTNINGEETIKEKGNMDVEMTIDAVHLAQEYNTAILFTGDSDFLALIVYLKNLGKKVYIFSSKNNISEELRTGGHGYIDILKISEIWGKELNIRKND